MSELPKGVRRALSDHDAYDPVDADGAVYELTTVPFDVRVHVTADGTPTFVVTVRAPTLSAATADEVTDAIQQGWFETFQRRLEDADMALRDGTDDEPTARIEGDELVVEATVSDEDPRRGAADAKAFAEYVEGTYMEGIVPGYDYRDPVASMRERAREF